MADSFHWRRPVFKFGTSTLTGGTAQLSLGRLADLVEQVATVQMAGAQPIVVSSGAITVGRQRLGSPRDRKDVSFRQILAAVGQSRLMHLYDEFFEFHGITSAQVLVTRADLAERQRYLNARNTLLGLCARGVIPIVNENDVVASEEIKVGDNDTLSALVANLVDADLLVLVSDTPGLYTADPLVDDGAQLVHEVVSITPQVEAYASGSSSGLGTGGMSTKVSAAKLATSSGTEVRIVDGGEPNVIVRVLRGESIGTRFLAASDRMESRKRWILSGLSHSGKLMVDAGAARAVQKAGASLLPAGIVDVQGAFERGDSVDIVAPDGNTVARGITNYDWNDVRKLLGRQSLEIEDMLGYTYGSYIVHRDDLVRYNRQEQVTHA
ncbi:MAG TPA: glutamate 5-kinase [Chloroflexota bacterium]|jgi:glutamate 5-kinase